MLCTAFPGRSSTVTIDGINYEYHQSSNVKNRYYTVVSASKYLTGDIVLAENVKNDGRDYPVRFFSSRAFAGCSGITSITIPSGMLQVGSPGEGCTELGEFRVAEKNANFRAVDGILMTRDGEIALFPPKHRAKYRCNTSLYSNGGYGAAFRYCSIDSLFFTPQVRISLNTFWGFKGNVIFEGTYSDYKFLEGIDNSSTVTVIGSDKSKAAEYCSNVKSFPYWGELVEVGPGHVIFEVKHDEAASSARLEKVVLDGKELMPDADGIYSFYTLVPETDYQISICYSENGSKNIFPLEFRTPYPDFSVSKEQSYMGKIEMNISRNSLLRSDIYEYGVYFHRNERVCGKFIADKENNTCIAYNLVPGMRYSVVPYAIINGVEYLLPRVSGWGFSTESGMCSNVRVKTWHSAAEVEGFSLPDDGTFYPDEVFVRVSYSGEDVKISDLPHTWTGLEPDSKIYFHIICKKGDDEGEFGFPEFKTQDLGISVSSKESGPTSAVLSLRYSDSGKFSGKEKDYMYTVNKITCNGVPLERFDCVELTGLEPKSDNTAVIRFEAVSPNGKKTFSADKSYSFKTQALELRTENPRVPSLGSAIASATTNISDRETGVGFQWKKYDAPAAVTPGEGYAAVFDGSAEGYIRNLQPDHYYNLRAFYKSAAGKYHYSEWVTFDPSDFSYFEPIVHTYPIDNITATYSDVRGYVMQGSDDISEQGFEYWPEADDTRRLREYVASRPDAQVVFATGQVMTARLENLLPGSEYQVRSFVVADGVTYYGETQRFATPEISGLYGIAEEVPVVPVAYYDTTGRRYAAPQRGLNIVVYSDGTVEKRIFRH